MKQFEVGKTYRLHGFTVKRVVTVVKRTKCYVTVTGDYSGRLIVRNDRFFGDFEFLWVPIPVCATHTMQILCFADNEIK